MVNVIICGTPGTGKSTLVEKLKLDKSLDRVNFVNLSKFAIDNDCTCGYDDELGSHVIDEDKLDLVINPILENSGKVNIVECIHADLVEPNLIDLVFVCRTDNTILYDRLKARNYNEVKISNNIQAEIFQTILDEVKEIFTKESMRFELFNNSLDDLDKNVSRVKDELCKLVEQNRELQIN